MGWNDRRLNKQNKDKPHPIKTATLTFVKKFIRENEIKKIALRGENTTSWKSLKNSYFSGTPKKFNAIFFRFSAFLCVFAATFPSTSWKGRSCTQAINCYLTSRLKGRYAPRIGDFINSSHIKQKNNLLHTHPIKPATLTFVKM